MKKINLNSVKTFLSRDEMRVINGGDFVIQPGGCASDSNCSSGCSSYRINNTRRCDHCCVALKNE